MSRQGRNFISRLSAALLLTAVMAFESFAANARISFSDPSTQVGQEVTVTMKFSSTDGQLLGDTKVTLNYDTAMLEYVGGSDNVSGDIGILQVRGGSGTAEVASELRFKALRSGTAAITVSDWEGYDNNGQVLAEVKTGSSAITIQGLPTSSDDASLQSLQISPGTLDPSFSPATDTYRATVGLDTENLTVSAVPNNEKATVALEGDAGLQPGENTVLCKVTAEDGSTVKNYTILVNKVEGGESNGEATAPEEMPQVLAELNSLAKKVQIISLPADMEIPGNLKESEITIGDAKVIGWVPEGDGDPAYCVFYGMNENGDRDFYRFDRKDKTLQRYFDDGEKINPEVREAAEKYNELVDDYNKMKWISRGVGAALLLLSLVLLILLIVARRSQDSFGKPAARRGEERAPKDRGAGKGMTKEQRYMMGEEDDPDSEYDDDYDDEYDDELSMDAYQPEPAEPEEPEMRQRRSAAKAEVGQAGRGVKEPVRRPQAVTRSRPAVQVPLGNGERPAMPGENPTAAQAAAAQTAAALERPPAKDTDDFEIFDLDE